MTRSFPGTTCMDEKQKNNMVKFFNKLLFRCFKSISARIEHYENARIQGLLKIGCPDFFIPRPHRILGAQYMQIGRLFSSLPGLRMECLDEYHGQHFSPKLLIGEGVSFNYYCHVGCINKIVIGNHVMVGSYVLITDHSHGELERTSVPVAKRKLLSKGPVIIEDNVWIGEHACIMPGVTIGEGSIIGANAVVTHNVPAYSLAVGAPAKVVKQL